MPSRQQLAERLCAQIRAWDRDRAARPVITAYPADTPDYQLPGGLVIGMRHIRLVVSFRYIERERDDRSPKKLASIPAEISMPDVLGSTPLGASDAKHGGAGSGSPSAAGSTNSTHALPMPPSCSVPPGWWNAPARQQSWQRHDGRSMPRNRCGISASRCPDSGHDLRAGDGGSARPGRLDLLPWPPARHKHPQQGHVCNEDSEYVQFILSMDTMGNPAQPLGSTCPPLWGAPASL
jgi:hypothetical protein